MKNTVLHSALLLSLGLGLVGAANAQSYQFKNYSPGIKSSAGYLNSNRNNAPGTVKDGVLSMPTGNLYFPEAVRGTPQEMAIEVFALGGGVTVTSVRTTLADGSSPMTVLQTDCEGKVMADGEKCTILLGVDNSNGRGANRGQVHVTGTDSAGKTITAGSSTYWHVHAPQARIDGQSHNFADTEAGTVSSPKFVQVYAATPAPLTIDNIANTANFRVNSVNCTTEQGNKATFPVTLRHQNTGDYCDIGVVFAPTAPVAANESMTLVDNDDLLNESINLSGTGTAAKSYALLWDRGRSGASIEQFVDKLGFKKTGSWNNFGRFVGSKLLSSGKYYIEIQNSMVVSQFGLTQSNTTYDTAPTDKVFSPTSASLPNTANFGILVDLDSRTLRAVDDTCSAVGPTIALDPGVAYTPSIYVHYNSATNSSIRVNFGQYSTRCNMPGFQNGWFTLQ